MRSVLDHFADPFLALKEAYRVLKPTGTLLIGLTVSGGSSTLRDNCANYGRGPKTSIASRITKKFQREGFQALINAVARKLLTVRADHDCETDDHMFHWRYDDLISLLNVTKFTVIKEHWQKPPFSMCVYLSARKSKH
jgi:ubiquinone/menaquinone biosynthesis C-methylase UbiE